MSRPPNLLGFGVIATVVTFGGLFWWAEGMPSIALKDGDYGCKQDVIAGVPAMPGPGATVTGGELVDVWDFNMSSGQKSSLEWSDFERSTPSEFTVVSEMPLRPSATYVCTQD